MRNLIITMTLAVAVTGAYAAVHTTVSDVADAPRCVPTTGSTREDLAPKVTLPDDSFVAADGDTVVLEVAPQQRHGRLDARDYYEVAQELGVEVAAIKAVVAIEAGHSHKGFWSEDKPLINFDLSMFRRMAQRNGVKLARYQSKYPVVFQRPNSRRYGSQQAAQQARLDAAMRIDTLSAIQGTFWGMFQIGGFNWRKCGAQSPEEFVRLMSRSERDQLELFAEFIRQSGMLPSLRRKDWASFARQYNGASYARRGYHTRMAQAYNRYRRQPDYLP